PGLHTCYNGRYNGQRTREGEPIPENRSQFGSQAATRLREAGIASNRGSACRGESVPGPCTHRPSHHESLQHPKSVREPLWDPAAEGGADDWGEVVTRYPYRKVGMDHLLSTEYLRIQRRTQGRVLTLFGFQGMQPKAFLWGLFSLECTLKTGYGREPRRSQFTGATEEKLRRAHGGCLGARSR